ncbi:hypothetical protein [Bartonella sp. DB5-6]|nr:hypothetical protein [Bartonella sp. DB5-6]
MVRKIIAFAKELLVRWLAISAAKTPATLAIQSLENELSLR